ncbi:unnamed protein product [Rhizoctonia solani]|uniref:Homeobox domain-containing protein n=1 Tax=Rhizoctonia solani TaxID=456999 RepID=A0A8H2WUE3_9AGAM|nr:unnamed protein product [Rhizoctonia solani]
MYTTAPCAAQQSLVDEPRRSRRTASAQLVVSTDHTHSTDITIEADGTPKPPSPAPMPAVAPGDLESPLSPPSASSTPSQSATFSNAGRTRSATLASPLRSTLDPDDDQKPSSIGPQRVRSATLSSPTASTNAAATARANLQKRKRSRVTPEQLAHLERVFAIDRSPTAARRKEISEQLGMQERQTQIWFQNRRAKAKLVESKGRSGRPGSPGSGRDTPPDTPPELSPGYEADLQALLHETDPISIIPCTDLTIGSWHRIADRTGRHDLVAYISDARASLTWFIHSGGHGFKMEIPISTVADTEFTQSAPTHPGHGIASFYVSEKPIFYMEDAANGGAWQICDDWTEGRQASHVMKHQLVGSSVQLGHAMRNFEARRQGLGRPMQIPQPPMLNVQPAPHAHQQPHMFSFPPNRSFTHGRKRSYSNPAAPIQMGDVFGPDYVEESRFGAFQMPSQAGGSGASAASHGPTGVLSSHGPAGALSSHGPVAGTLASHGAGHGHAHQGSMSDFSSIPISQLSQRPFSADPSRQFPQDPVRQFNQDQARQFSQDPSRPFSADPTRQFNQDPSRPFSADSTRTFTQEMPRFDPSRPYMDRRATFDAAAHGHAHGHVEQQRRYSEQTAQGEGYAGYGDVYAEGMFPGMTPNSTMAPNAAMGGQAQMGNSPMFGMNMNMGYTGLEDVEGNPPHGSM